MKKSNAYIIMVIGAAAVILFGSYAFAGWGMGGGHHGGNQPGKDLATGKVAICAENHGYAVDADSLRRAGEPVEITHVNLNDDTVEGLAHSVRPIFSVQYHPEASPGPHDAAYFFGRFRELVERATSGDPVSGAEIARSAPAASV